MTILKRLRRDAMTTFIVGVCVATASLATSPREVDLEGAILLARSNSRLLEAARIRIEEAQGDLTTASILLVENPELGLAGGPRRSNFPGIEDTTDLAVGLEQRFEIGGQRGHRIGRAEASLAAMVAAADEAQRVLELAVATAFWEALAADKLVAVLDESRSLFETLNETARLRLERGEATPLEQNTARVRLAEAERRLASAVAQRVSATLRLMELLAMPLATPVTVRGEFPGARTLESESVLVARALGTRPDLLNLDRQIAAAEEEAQLANAEAWPDLSLGVFYEEEEEDKIFLVGLSIPLPLLDRNQGERHRSEAVVRRLQAERDAAALSAESEVRRAYSEYEMARRSVHLYDSEVLLALKESLGLLEKALGAGQIGLPEVILVQREVLDATEGYLSAQLEFAHARARLRAASHQPQTNTEEE